MMPTVDQVIKAIKESDAIEVQPNGAYAANLLGISTQIPMKIELYTNGPKKDSIWEAGNISKTHHTQKHDGRGNQGGFDSSGIKANWKRRC